MARSTSRTVSGGASTPYYSPPFIVDTNVSDFNLGFGCVVTGTVNYTVQHCYDDSAVIQAGNATWFDHAVVASKTANADGNYNNNSTQGPVSGIRVKLSTGIAGTSVVMNIIQTGPGGR
ncbi:hypothetical protein ABNQ39_00165 (plasmid) [Azospirillum sp. A26]|uniref:hypothetical protein n=1 Tax=Azospirillum sp. A26 TaxID=3160607 RepID=UPI00367321BE